MITLVLIVLSLGAAAGAQTVEPTQIIVTGEGVIRATPDQAWVTIGAEARSKTSRDAQQRTAEAMTAVIQKITSFGIPKDAIRTTAIDLQPEFDYVSGKQISRGYVARNTVEVRVDELPRLGDVLDAVVGSGATMIQGLRFDVIQRQQLEATALQSAVRNASFKANAIALGSKSLLDRVVKIEELPSDDARPMMMRDLGLTRTADAQTPVSPGELEIRVQIRLTATTK